MLAALSRAAAAYRTVSTEVGLQYQAQIIQSQVESYIIDCNGGIAFEGDSVYIVNDVTETGGTIHVFPV
jgi:adenine/guanine phosphoribosyltransferase-like PRPP-binding protein